MLEIGHFPLPNYTLMDWHVRVVRSGVIFAQQAPPLSIVSWSRWGKLNDGRRSRSSAEWTSTISTTRKIYLFSIQRTSWNLCVAYLLGSFPAKGPWPSAGATLCLYIETRLFHADLFKSGLKVAHGTTRAPVGANNSKFCPPASHQMAPPPPSNLRLVLAKCSVHGLLCLHQIHFKALCLFFKSMYQEMFIVLYFALVRLKMGFI